MSFTTKLRNKIQSDIFSSSDVRALFYSISEAAIHNGISRGIKSSELIQLRRGLYLFNKSLQKNSVSKFLIANKLYGPSYISFESALSFHGLIPEAVYTTTSACYQRKKKIFENNLGVFSFNYIPCSNFFLDVKYENGLLVASPLRALFDYIYFYKKSYVEFDDIVCDLRIERELLFEVVKTYKFNEMQELAELYKKNNVRDFFNLLIMEFK